MTATGLILPPEQLRDELLARADAVGRGHGDDEDNTRWLACVVAVHGWPVRSLVGREAATATLLLASRAPFPYRASWAAKITNAMQAGSVPVQPARQFLERVMAERVKSLANKGIVTDLRGRSTPA